MPILHAKQDHTGSYVFLIELVSPLVPTVRTSAYRVAQHLTPSGEKAYENPDLHCRR